MRSDIIVVEEGFTAVPSDLRQAAMLAKNGLFSFRRLTLGAGPFIEVCSKLGPGYPGPGIKDWSESIKIFAPRIPRIAMQEVESFFRKVYDQFKAEAIVLLYFTPANGGQWRFVAPSQEVESAHLSYTSPGGAPTGWYLAGSVHSHHTMSAFHSGIDDRDEMDWDGVHVTVGKITSPNFEYAASIVIGGVRIKIDISQIVDAPPAVNFPSSWMLQVRKHQPALVEKGKKISFQRGGYASGRYDDRD